MAYPMLVNWFANADPLGLIAPLQSNSTSPYAMTLTNGGSYIYPKNCGFRRNVAITSADDNSAVDFTITGITYSYPAGFAVTSETLTGPDASTVLSDDTYVQINSIVASGAFTNVTVTVGDSGDAIVPLDYQRKVFDVSISVDLPRESALTVCEAFATNQLLYKPSVNGPVFDFDPAEATSLASAGSATGQAITIPSYTDPIDGLLRIKYFTPSTALYFTFGNSTGTVGTYTGACPITVIQQGLTS